MDVKIQNEINNTIFKILPFVRHREYPVGNFRP